ncbi:hypothetical protein ACKFKF_04250 [Phormidesmis sp. 146-12]
MNIQNNLFGLCSKIYLNGEGNFFDLQSLVNKLLLFDTFILYSPNLREIAYLVKAFGFEGTLALLSSDALRISCELRITAQVGQTSFLVPSGKALPLGTYSVSYGFSADRRKWISDNLRNVGTANLNNNHTKKLKRAVVAALDNNYLQDFESQLLKQVNGDLAGNRGIESSTAIVLKKEKGLDVKPDDFLIKLHQVDNQIFQVETNLGEVFSLDEVEVHKIAEKAVLGVAGLNQRIAEMKVHNAVSGFLEDEAPLLEDKLEFLFQSIDPHQLEVNLNRVLRLKNCPSIISESHQTVDVEKLLEVRESQELKIFREWLRKIDNVSDSEIVEQLNDIRSRLGVFAQGSTGKASRLAISTLAGLVPGVGVISGLGLGVVDTFLLEKVLP